LGSFLFAEDLTDALVLLQNVQITDFENTISQSYIAVLNFGTLRILNSEIRDIPSSLFQLNTMSAEFDRVIINGITCEATSSTTCIIEGNSLDLKISNSEISDMLSNSPLMTFANCPKVWMQNLQLFDAGVFDETTVSLENLYAFHVTKVQDLIIENSEFRQLSFSYLFGKQSDITIMKSVFSNQIKGRLLATSEEESITYFIHLNESNSLMKEVSFLGHDAFMNGVNTSVYFVYKLFL